MPCIGATYKERLVAWSRPRESMNFATMLLSTILAQALLASVGLALPSGKTRLDNRVTRRASGAYTSRAIASNSTHASYSPSWSGVVLHAPAVRPAIFTSRTTR